MTAERARPPAPPGLSAAARAALDAPDVEPHSFPADDDLAGWRRHIAAVDAASLDRVRSLTPAADRYRRTSFRVDGMTTHVLQPIGVPDDAPIVLDLHGGGLVQSGGDLTWMVGAIAAVRRPALTWCPDYRMPPDHRFPVGLEDCLAVYRAAVAVRPPDRVLLVGSSAGGNLALALLLRARDERLPMPAALVLDSPEADLTESGDTFRTLAGVDRLRSLAPINRLYAGGRDLAEPLLSPLFGDLTGFPPSYLRSGTRDLFLSTTVRLHRRLLAAAVPAELHVFEALPHGGFGPGVPEDDEVTASQDAFERRFL